LVGKAKFWNNEGVANNMSCGSCSEKVDFNRRCTSCGYFGYPNASPPGKCHCGGSVNFATHCKGIGKGRFNHGSYHRCSSCLSCFNAIQGSAKESSPIDCPRCQKQLNFNRGCENCKVLYAEAGKVCCPYCSDSIPHDTRCAESRNCESCGRTFQVLALPAGSVETEYKDGKFIAVDPDYYHSVVRLEIPASPSNPKHFDHLAWKYCQFLASTEE
jgi:hypothetical protein